MYFAKLTCTPEVQRQEKKLSRESLWEDLRRLYEESADRSYAMHTNTTNMKRATGHIAHVTRKKWTSDI